MLPVTPQAHAQKHKSETAWNGGSRMKFAGTRFLFAKATSAGFPYFSPLCGKRVWHKQRFLTEPSARFGMTSLVAWSSLRYETQADVIPNRRGAAAVRNIVSNAKLPPHGAIIYLHDNLIQLCHLDRNLPWKPKPEPASTKMAGW